MQKLLVILAIVTTSRSQMLAAAESVPPLTKNDPATLVIATFIALVFLAFGLSAIPSLLHEIRFYRSCKWDFKKDSGKRIFKQHEVEARFSFLPLGVIKLLYHANRILLMLIVVVPLAFGLKRNLI